MEVLAYKPTSSNWAPPYMIEERPHVHVMLLECDREKDEDRLFIVCVGGADDGGMEFTSGDLYEIKDKFCDVMLLEDVTIQALEDIGFVASL